MKKTIKGYLFNRIETLGKKKFNHLGFEDKNKQFSNLLAKFVPRIGMRIKVKLTIETNEEKE